MLSAKDSKTPGAARRPYVICRGCGGRAWQDGGDGRPHGWYSLSVSVPPGLGKNGKPFVWCGQWCSAACLAGSMADLQTAELRARMAYDATPPVGGAT